MDSVHHRLLPAEISAKLGSVEHFSQVNYQMIAASQAGSREVKGGLGSSGRFRRVRSASLLPFRTWCSPACTFSAQLLHMECAMQFAGCVAGCVCKQHALGSSVPRRSTQGCAFAACVCAQNAHIIHAWFAPIWLGSKFSSFQAWLSSKDDRKLVNLKMVSAPCSFNVHSAMDLIAELLLSLKVKNKQMFLTHNTEW